jgi:hypothetical protein
MQKYLNKKGKTTDKNLDKFKRDLELNEESVRRTSYKFYLPQKQ